MNIFFSLSFYMLQETNKQVEFCAQFFANLPGYYEDGDLIVKRQIIGLIYPEKFVFKNNSFQTTRKNAAIPLICRTVKGCGARKNKESAEFSALSSVVTRIGQISNRVWEDFLLLSTLR